MRIRIILGQLALDAELYDTPTACKVAGALPIRTSFNTWGDEIYFSIPVEAELDESAREEVEAGDLGYWPTGQAFCIFFGPTPMSTGGKIIPASAVNIVGRIIGDAARLKEAMQENEVILDAS
ncbi:MAG: cyclophilin-like fold protein [Thermodesulfobacteriota bacterium]|nr:cyclophilin-like fold protein [Thermodesulfobacteriota bacterium]